MSERRQKVVKEFPAEMARERVGWMSMCSEERENDLLLRIDGGYATVADEGAAMTFTETGDGELVYSNSKLLRGFVTACAWNFIAVKKDVATSWDASNIKTHPDVNITGYERYGDTRGGENLFAGRDRGEHYVDLDDEASVEWSVGDDEIVASMKRRLELHQAGELYTPMYLSINGIAGARVVWRQPDATRDEIATYQLADPTHVETTEHELELVTAFDTSLGRRVRAGERLLEKTRKHEFTTHEGLRFDDAVRHSQASYEQVWREAVLPRRIMSDTELPIVNPVVDMDTDDINTHGVKRDIASTAYWRRSAPAPWVRSLSALHEVELAASRRDG